MPQNTTISCAANTWTLLTSNDVSAIRASNLGNAAIWLQAAVGAVVPTSPSGALQLLPNQTLAADLLLAELWPGIAGANRVYALAPALTGVSVSHE